MIIEIDVGNTRAKWRLIVRDAPVPEVQESGAIFMKGDPSGDALNLIRSIANLCSGDIEVVRVSNVRGDPFECCLGDAIKSEWSLVPEFPKAVRECAGVVNGYEDPAKLGVDRWLAMLAAFNSARQRCCIVDCGTTITVDLISDAGLHLGGYIVPGIIMMKTILTKKSSVLQWEMQQTSDTLPGHNTAEAINHGALAMITGFIGEVITTAAADGRAPMLYLTGGDGLVVKQCLRQPASYQPALVLDGLRYACVKPHL